MDQLLILPFAGAILRTNNSRDSLAGSLPSEAVFSAITLALFLYKFAGVERKVLLIRLCAFSFQKEAVCMKMDKTAQKAMAQKLQEASQDKINRNIKDSVFCNLFGQPEYLYQLYQALHPEDSVSENA